MSQPCEQSVFACLLYSCHCATNQLNVLEMARLFAQVGVSAEHLQRLPSRLFQELAAAGRCLEGICTVCQEQYAATETVTQLPCKHLFHKECITMWLKDSKQCPMCMSEVVPEHPT